MFKRIAAAIAIAALGLSLVGCAIAPKPESTPKPTAVEGLPAVYLQELETYKCGAYLCGTIDAPIDWNKPDGETFELFFKYLPVSGSKKFLFVNPGGPGASGADLVTDSFESIGTPTLRSAYNIVGFDPRGTKGSNPIKCFDSKRMDEYLYTDSGFPAGSPKDLAVSRVSIAEFIEACQKGSGGFLEFIDTSSAAKDLDLLRAVFGQVKLDYLGYSYGTLLGSTYAALFPKNVGLFVLDGAIDPTVSDEDKSFYQLKGFDLALRNYLKECIEKQSDCPFSGSVSQGLSRVSQFLTSVSKAPLPAGDGRMVGQVAASTGLYMALYTEQYWPYLTQAFNEAFDSKEGSVFMQLADFYNNRNEDGSYSSNMFEAFISISCIDQRSDSSPEAVAIQNNRMLSASPTLGRFWQNGAEVCANWPYPVAQKPASYAAEGAPTILVIGTTNDPATPYQHAVNLARDVLANGFLLTYEGEGHTAYGRSNSCVANVVDDFLLKGILPASDPVC